MKAPQPAYPLSYRELCVWGLVEKLLRTSMYKILYGSVSTYLGWTLQAGTAASYGRCIHTFKETVTVFSRGPSQMDECLLCGVLPSLWHHCYCLFRLFLWDLSAVSLCSGFSFSQCIQHPTSEMSWDCLTFSTEAFGFVSTRSVLRSLPSPQESLVPSLHPPVLHRTNILIWIKSRLFSLVGSAAARGAWRSSSEGFALYSDSRFI